jgi:hypothetical protein
MRHEKSTLNFGGVETVKIRLLATTPFLKIVSSVFSSLNKQTKFHSHSKRVCVYFTFTGDNQLQNQKQLEEQ